MESEGDGGSVGQGFKIWFDRWYRLAAGPVCTGRYW